MPLTSEQIRQRVEELRPWFHNMELGGVRTAPEHFLHDYPANKFARFAHVIPEGLTARDRLRRTVFGEAPLGEGAVYPARAER